MIANILSYDIQNFIMFSREVYWATIELYNTDLWPLQLPTVLLSCLWIYFCFRQRYLKLSIIYVGFVWMFLANFFLQKYFLQIYWPAKYCVIIFNLYGLFMITSSIFKLKNANSYLKRYVGLILMLVSVLLPSNFLLGMHQVELTQLFGFGAESTAVGTIGFLMQFRSRLLGVSAFIPMAWLILSYLNIGNS